MMNSRIFLVIIMIPLLSCSLVQHTGGETTNGDGIIAVVKDNSIECYFDSSSETGCRKLLLFDSDFNPQTPEKYYKEAALTGNNLTFDSLNPATYVLLARNICTSKAALIQNININNSSAHNTHRAFMSSTVTIKGIVKGIDTAYTGYVYVKGTDISSYCTNDGNFELSFVPQGECSIIAIVKSSLIGSEKMAFDTLAIQVNGDTPSSKIELHPLFTPDGLPSGTVGSLTP